MGNDAVLPPKLQAIVEDFGYSEGREKIELLIQYSENLPEIPPELQSDRSEMEAVEECMTPVFVQAQLQDGKMHFYFDVPRESPTVRGFAVIMGEGLSGCTPQEVLAVPNDFFSRMGLEQVLTMQRLNGLSAILAHMKRLAAQAISA
jgi:cysteine desulfuration protein SufE